jgi:hypothetical protein
VKEETMLTLGKVLDALENHQKQKKKIEYFKTKLSAFDPEDKEDFEKQWLENKIQEEEKVLQFMEAEELI